MSNQPSPDAIAARNALRTALLSGTPKAKSVLITVFGVEIELRQPSLAVIMKARDEVDAAARAADMIIEYAYVPGTNEQVFEAGDRDVILQWPFGEDLMVLQNAVTELTGLDVDDEEDKLVKDPLAEPSSSTA